MLETNFFASSLGQMAQNDNYTNTPNTQNYSLSH